MWGLVYYVGVRSFVGVVFFVGVVRWVEIEVLCGIFFN